MLTYKLIETAAERTGWNCTIKKVTRYNQKFYEINFNTDTRFNQDVQYDYTVKTLDDIIIEIYSTYDNYDPDEQALLWIGSDGHGKNGAPYRLRDIITDMDEVKDLLGELYAELLSLTC